LCALDNRARHTHAARSVVGAKSDLNADRVCLLRRSVGCRGPVDALHCELHGRRRAPRRARVRLVSAAPAHALAAVGARFSCRFFLVACSSVLLLLLSLLLANVLFAVVTLRGKKKGFFFAHIFFSLHIHAHIRRWASSQFSEEKLLAVRSHFDRADVDGAAQIPVLDLPLTLAAVSAASGCARAFV